VNTDVTLFHTRCAGISRAGMSSKLRAGATAPTSRPPSSRLCRPGGGRATKRVSHGSRAPARARVGVYGFVGIARALRTFLVSAAITTAASAFAQTKKPASQPAPTPPPYEYRAEHSRDGIGKFYMGREIAQVMGHQAADWLERPEREQEENTSLLVESLKLKPGDVVADIGCGTGYLSRRIARKVEPKGFVYGEEIQQEMLDLLVKNMAEMKIENVKPVLGTITDPKLPANSVDMIVMLDVYHEFDHPREMTEAMIKALKPGGRMVFVEFRGEDPKVPIKLVHKMSVAQVRKEMSVQPLKWSESIEVLPWQHIIIFTKP
jgi:ubiquinone/menaquinone biosynthesis C-methylase UbiE